MANYCHIIKPFSILALLQVNASSINACLSHLNESTFNKLIESLCSTGEAIEKKLIAMFSNDDILKVQEEAVFDFVYRYVAE